MGERRLLGYRVVCESPETGNREYLSTLADGLWHQRRSFLYRSEHAAKDDATLRDGRVVPVYLTVRRTKKGRAK